MAAQRRELDVDCPGLIGERLVGKGGGELGQAQAAIARGMGQPMGDATVGAQSAVQSKVLGGGSDRPSLHRRSSELGAGVPPLFI